MFIGRVLTHIVLKKPGKSSEFFRAYLDTSAVNFTFIVVFETWLKYEFNPYLEIDYFLSQNVCCSNRRKRGINLFYRQEISGEVIDEISDVLDSYGTLVFRAGIPVFGNIKVCCRCRPPGKSGNE